MRAARASQPVPMVKQNDAPNACPVRSNAPMLADLETPSAPMPKYPLTLASTIRAVYSAAMTDATDRRLAGQYEAYPYPSATRATRQSV